MKKNSEESICVGLKELVDYIREKDMTIEHLQFKIKKLEERIEELKKNEEKPTI